MLRSRFESASLHGDARKCTVMHGNARRCTTMLWYNSTSYSFFPNRSFPVAYNTTSAPLACLGPNSHKHDGISSYHSTYLLQVHNWWQPLLPIDLSFFLGQDTHPLLDGQRHCYICFFFPLQSILPSVDSWCLLYTSPTSADESPQVWLFLTTENALRHIVARWVERPYVCPRCSLPLDWTKERCANRHLMLLPVLFTT